VKYRDDGERQSRENLGENRRARLRLVNARDPDPPDPVSFDQSSCAAPSRAQSLPACPPSPPPRPSPIIGGESATLGRELRKRSLARSLFGLLIRYFAFSLIPGNPSSPPPPAPRLLRRVPSRLFAQEKALTSARARSRARAYIPIEISLKSNPRRRTVDGGRGAFSESKCILALVPQEQSGFKVNSRRFPSADLFVEKLFPRVNKYPASGLDYGNSNSRAAHRQFRVSCAKRTSSLILDRANIV